MKKLQEFSEFILEVSGNYGKYQFLENGKWSGPYWPVDSEKELNFHNFLKVNLRLDPKRLEVNTETLPSTPTRDAILHIRDTIGRIGNMGER